MRETPIVLLVALAVPATVWSCCGAGKVADGDPPSSPDGQTPVPTTTPGDGARVEPSSCTLDAGPVEIASTERAAATPAIAWTGSRYGVTWLTGGDVLFVQADESARAIGSGTVVATDAKDAPTPEVLRELDLLWTGQEYLVSANVRKNKGRKVCAGVLPVNTDGTRETNPICVLPGTTIQFDRQVALAWTGTRVLAVAATGNLADQLMAASFDLPALRVLEAQAVMDGAPATTAHDSMDFPLALEWTGTEGRWVAARIRDDGQTSFYCGRVDADGNPIGTPSRLEGKAFTDAGLPVGLFRDRLPAAVTDSSLYVARVQPGKLVSVPGFGIDGKKAGSLSGLESRSSAWLLALRSAGDHVWAVWLENRRDKKGASYLYDMWAARLKPDGAMLGEPVRVSDVRVGDELHVDLTPAGQGAGLVWTPHGTGAGVHMATIACK